MHTPSICATFLKNLRREYTRAHGSAAMHAMAGIWCHTTFIILAVASKDGGAPVVSNGNMSKAIHALQAEAPLRVVVIPAFLLRHLLLVLFRKGVYLLLCLNPLSRPFLLLSVSLLPQPLVFLLHRFKFFGVTGIHCSSSRLTSGANIIVSGRLPARGPVRIC